MPARLALALVLALAPAAHATGAGAVEGRVKLARDGAPVDDRSGLVVSLEGVPGNFSPRSPAQIAQENLAFKPELTVVVVGESVEFPNRDKVFHNVFSLSKPARFDLGLYKSGTSKSVTFKSAGTVDVYCNIHPEMIARVRVVESPFFAVTGADGSFRIEHVPAGTYPVVAWHRSGGEARGTVTVAPGGAAHVELEVAEQKGVGHHVRKDGSPYGRYK